MSKKKRQKRISEDEITPRFMIADGDGHYDETFGDKDEMPIKHFVQYDDRIIRKCRCGGCAVLDTIDMDGFIMYRVMCENSELLDSGHFAETNTFDTSEEAIEVWNKEKIKDMILGLDFDDLYEESEQENTCKDITY